MSAGHEDYARRLVLCSRLTEPALRAAIANAGFETGSHGLDVACGVGVHSSWLAEAVAPGGRVTGVDISREMLAKAEARLRGSPWERAVRFEQGDLRRLSFPPGSFDWVWCADAVYPGAGAAAGIEPAAILGEFARLVRPQGIVALAFWSQHRLLPGHPRLEARLNASGAPYLPHRQGMAPELHFSCALEWLLAAGLDQVSARSYAADFHAPLAPETRGALCDVFDMLWKGAKERVSPEDWGRFRELTDPEAAGCLLERRGYHGTIVYTVFRGRRA